MVSASVPNRKGSKPRGHANTHAHAGARAGCGECSKGLSRCRRGVSLACIVRADLPLSIWSTRYDAQCWRDRGPNSPQGAGRRFIGPGIGKPSQNRFDAPSSEYQILYAAQRLEGAFVETLLRRPTHRIVRRAFIEERMWTPLRLERTLTLAKIMDEGLLFHGVDASVSATDDYAPSRKLALELYQDFSTLDGLAYRSRHNNGEICYALFDRVSGKPTLATSSPWRLRMRMSSPSGTNW